MKKVVTLLALCFALNAPIFALTAPATTGAVPTATRTKEYCMVLATQRFMSTKVTITIGYGQERKFFSDNRYKDAEGKV